MEWVQLYEEIQNKLMNNLQSINFRNNYDYWIFDLDNTIYDFNLGLFRRISQRMTIYIKDFFNLNHTDALNLQKNMYKKYGLTLRGLIIEKKMNPEPFLEFVHDVDFDDLKIDNELKILLSKIKGHKSIYTNASFNHAKNILTCMGIFEEFEIIFDIKDSNYMLFKRGLRLFKGLCLLFLPNVPGATFIQGGTFIPDSRVPKKE